MKNEVIFVSGQRGSGKTYWTKHFIGGLNRFLLYDTLGEYEGTPRFTEMEPFLAHCKKTGGEVFCEVVYDTIDHRDFPLFCETALAMGNLYVIVEEIDHFADPHDIPEELARLIKHGRHYGVNVVVSQGDPPRCQGFSLPRLPALFCSNRSSPGI